MNPNADVRDCTGLLITGFQTWQNVIGSLLTCAEKTAILGFLCDWLKAAGDLVNQNIEYTSLDSRLDDITAADFDRKYFPLIYGAQGVYAAYIKV